MITAIEKLKKKDSLTEEERIKIESEDLWRKVLDPYYINPLEKKQKQEQEREQERERKRERERERKREQQKQKKRQRQKQRQRQRQQEQRHKFEEQERKMEEQNPNSHLEKRIQHEITDMIKEGYTKQKAFQKMYLQYHPDKNRDEDATQITQIINQLKEKENMDTNPCQKN